MVARERYFSPPPASPPGDEAGEFGDRADHYDVGKHTVLQFPVGDPGHGKTVIRIPSLSGIFLTRSSSTMRVFPPAGPRYTCPGLLGEGDEKIPARSPWGRRSLHRDDHLAFAGAPSGLRAVGLHLGAETVVVHGRGAEHNAAQDHPWPPKPAIRTSCLGMGITPFCSPILSLRPSPAVSLGGADPGDQVSSFRAASAATALM